MPDNSGRVLNTRSLTTAHRRLAAVLQPRMRVLDAGCGTGAITRGIAGAVGPDGHALGMDINPNLIDEARQLHEGTPCLEFRVGDAFATTLPVDSAPFDIATAARVLQWLAEPDAAVRSLAGAVRRGGGRVIVLDYSHEAMVWDPAPPDSMRRFYDAFLRWRSDAGMDNRMADHLAGLFADAGLADVRVHPEHETTRRGDPDFDTRIALWAHIADGRGRPMVEDGYLTETERETAAAEYRDWIRDTAVSQTLYLLAVEGVVP